jgi:hypothetical protein
MSRHDSVISVFPPLAIFSSAFCMHHAWSDANQSSSLLLDAPHISVLTLDIVNKNDKGQSNHF